MLYYCLITLIFGLATAKKVPWDHDIVPSAIYETAPNQKVGLTPQSCNTPNSRGRISPVHGIGFNLTSNIYILHYKGPCDLRKIDKEFPVYYHRFISTIPNELKLNLSYWSATKANVSSDLHRSFEKHGDFCEYRFVTGKRSKYRNITVHFHSCLWSTQIIAEPGVDVSRFTGIKRDFESTYALGPITLMERYVDNDFLYEMALILTNPNIHLSPSGKPALGKINATHSHIMVKYKQVTKFMAFYGILVECECGQIFRIRFWNVTKEYCIVTGLWTDSKSDNVMMSEVGDVFFLNVPIKATCSALSIEGRLTCEHTNGLCCKRGCKTNSTISDIPKYQSLRAVDLVELLVEPHEVRNCSACAAPLKYSFYEILKDID